MKERKTIFDILGHDQGRDNNTANKNKSPNNQPPNEGEPDDHDAKRFEHLYPGQKWQELAEWGLNDLLHLMQLLTINPENQAINRGIEQARNNGTGFARKKIFRPTKSRIKEELGDTQISEREFYRAEFDNILEANETIGGSVEIDISTKKQRSKLQIAGLTANQNQPTNLYIIGVIDRNTNKPKGIIYYIDGPRKKYESQRRINIIPEPRLT